MKNTKIIIVFIIIVLIIILIVGGMLIFGNNNNTNDTHNTVNINENEDNDELAIQEKEQEENNNAINTPPEFSEKPGYREYFTVNNCISQYLDTANINSSRYYSKNENGEFVLTVRQNDVAEIVKKITNNTSNIELYKEKLIFTPIKILRREPTQVDTYIAYGILTNTDLKYIKDACFAVNLDTKNKTFSIEPLNTNNLENASVAKLESIEKNDYNQFTYQEVNDQYKYKQLFNNFKRIMLIKPDVAYSILDEDYKQKRFGSYDYFESYINNNREHLLGITPKSYKVNDDNTVVQIKDQYSNFYEFNITNTMEYTAKIDNYIILLDKDIKKYNGYEDVEKVKYNIRRWIKMLNSKDYQFAYSYLDETFKTENYSNLQAFTQTMQNKYPDYYDLISISTEEEGNVFKSEVQLAVSNQEFSDKYMTIIMKLEDDNSFTLSFDMQ